jgi:predicted flap endonuclease-1-like 5' DNA nuclease
MVGKIMAEAALDKDKERLAKLWDAYEEQEREFNLALKKIASLEGKMTETSKINSTLKKVTEGRDREIRELEIKVTALTEENELFRPELERLETLYKDEKERYAKLFAITEELEEELENARVELEMRDKWFQKYFGQLENFNMAMKERAIMIRESKFTSPEKVKPVRFEKVDLGREEEEKPEKKVKFESLGPDEDQPEEKDDSSEPDESKKDLTELDLVDDEIAGKLKDAGIKDITELATMSTPELAKIEGISPTTARKLIKAAKDF